jgi:hypothetical protein
MRRLIQRDLMRGQWEQRAALLLLVGLLLTLVVSFYHGMSSLA